MKKKFLLLFLVLALALTAAGSVISACAEQECGTPALQNQPEEPAKEKSASRQSESADPASPAEQDGSAPQEGDRPAPPRPMPRAEGEHRPAHTAVSVTGCGKVTVPADAVQLSFRIRILSDSFKEGQARLSEAKSALFDAVRGVCEASGDGLPGGDSHRPVSDGTAGGYEFTSFVCVKLTDAAKAEEAKNAAEGTGAVHLYTYYLLENESEALKQAPSLALQDAAGKAETLLGQAGTLLRLHEECSWHSAADEPGQITVYANVRAKYAAAQQ